MPNVPIWESIERKESKLRRLRFSRVQGKQPLMLKKKKTNNKQQKKNTLSTNKVLFSIP